MQGVLTQGRSQHHLDVTPVNIGSENVSVAVVIYFPHDRFVSYSPQDFSGLDDHCQVNVSSGSAFMEPLKVVGYSVYGAAK